MPARLPKPSADGTMPTPTQVPGAVHTMTVIFDPVANTITRLMPERKIAIVENVPADFFKHAADREARSAIAGTRPGSKATVTELGSKTFAGVVASGRLTSHIVATRDGDTSTASQTMTRESWFSSGLKIEVSNIETGEHGMRSDTLASVTKAEPDASLFKVPDGYTVQSAPAHAPGGMHHGGRGPGEWKVRRTHRRHPPQCRMLHGIPEGHRKRWPFSAPQRRLVQ